MSIASTGVEDFESVYTENKKIHPKHRIKHDMIDETNQNIDQDSIDLINWNYYYHIERMIEISVN